LLESMDSRLASPSSSPSSTSLSASSWSNMRLAPEPLLPPIHSLPDGRGTRLSVSSSRASSFRLCKRGRNEMPCQVNGQKIAGGQRRKSSNGPSMVLGLGRRYRKQIRQERRGWRRTVFIFLRLRSARGVEGTSSARADDTEVGVAFLLLLFFPKEPNEPTWMVGVAGSRSICGRGGWRCLSSTVVPPADGLHAAHSPPSLGLACVPS
jgi:hypothetical protein